MDVREPVTSRLAMLGYAVTTEDTHALEYLTRKCRVDLLSNIHHKEVPDGLFCTLVDMVAGTFLYDKLASGTLEIQGLDFSTQPESISEGDVSVTFAGASDGTSSAEARFTAALNTMMHPPESILGAFRRLKW